MIFKMMNLLLLEKSLVFCGSDIGLVTAIASAAVEIITPFEWEGVCIPLMPYVARDVFQAPVPFIIGTLTLPKLSDISLNAAIVFLDNKLGSRDVPCEECSWFIRLPEVDANMPVSDGLQKHMKRIQQKFCQYLPTQEERALQINSSGNCFFGGMGQANAFNVSEKSRLSKAHQHQHHHRASASAMTSAAVASAAAASSSSSSAAAAAAGGEEGLGGSASSESDNHPKLLAPGDLVKTFLFHMSAEDKEALSRLMDAISRHNVAFCGDAVQPGGWIQYCKYSKTSNCEEFHPQWFMQPRRAHTEFQEAVSSSSSL